MAHVMQCDQCEKIDKFNKLKHVDVEIQDADNNDRYMNNKISGDFCSLECAKKYIDERIHKLWYK